MDNLLGTIIFILPGFLMYFWLQSFGINPVVKHSPGEFTAISALLWLPTSIATLALYNLIPAIYNLFFHGARYVWTLDMLKEKSGDLRFLIAFLFLSVIVSLLISACWSMWVNPWQMKLINRIRNWRGVASLSKSASVWDEVFTNNDAQVVQVGKIDKPESSIIGGINKASRTFEPERHLSLDNVDFFTELVKNHEINVSRVFYDTKSGTYIKIFNSDEIKEAQEKDLQATSFSSPNSN